MKEVPRPAVKKAVLSPRSNLQTGKASRPTTKDWAARANLVFGLLLVATGVFLLVALNNPLEIIVYVSGPVLALSGIALIIVMAVKRRPAVSTLTGLAATVLGSALAIHDLVLPPGVAVLVHLSIAIGALILGVLQLALRKRLWSRLFPGRRTSAGDA